MHTVLTVTPFDANATEKIAAIFEEFDATSAGEDTGPRKRQVFTYYDLLIEVADFSDGTPLTAYTHGHLERDLREALGPHLLGSGAAALSTPSGKPATRFYSWAQPESPFARDDVFSTVIVNRVAAADVPEVTRLFADLDASGFPYEMGTLRRQLFVDNGIYFHVQDFVMADGHAVIDRAWKDADPRFVQVCADLDPLVAKYDLERWRSTDDQIAIRLHRWERA